MAKDNTLLAYAYWIIEIHLNQRENMQMSWKFMELLAAFIFLLDIHSISSDFIIRARGVNVAQGEKKTQMKYFGNKSRYTFPAP